MLRNFLIEDENWIMGWRIRITPTVFIVPLLIFSAWKKFRTGQEFSSLKVLHTEIPSDLLMHSKLTHKCNICIWSNWYLLGIDYYCGESTGWMLIKERRKTNDLLLYLVPSLLTQIIGCSRGRNACGTRGYFPFY